MCCKSTNSRSKSGLKNVSCEFDRWAVETQLCKVRDTSDTLIGRAIHYIVLFQDFTLSSISFLPTVRGTADRRYITRRVFHSNMQQYFQVDTLDILSVLAVIGLQYNCSYTPSTRSISSASITPIRSVLAARNKCTRYSEHAWNICCDAGCCSRCSCCCCPSGASAVDVPPSLAA